MADELAIKGKQVVSLVIEKGIPDVIRPLQREIYLSPITHIRSKSFLAASSSSMLTI